MYCGWKGTLMNLFFPAWACLRVPSILSRAVDSGSNPQGGPLALCLDDGPNIPALYPVATTSESKSAQMVLKSGGRRKPMRATTTTRSSEFRRASSQRSEDPDAHTRAHDDTLLSLKQHAAHFLGMYDSEL
ncbi:hypothetical protein B0H13DRAFT_1914363 [Mycena leptocephala]|nr:hypothetical protein B0H13DRAFT_1914363 [Mycena leptocephala]